ncbi:MAG: ribonuclease III [Selenomonadaceae bacterium]|nr:ribonuclease III [Selenomonadaceae bacterium]
MDAPRRRVLQAFQKNIGVTFNRIEILNIALTHSSYSRSYGKVFDDNEKLEFMGDAVIELSSSTLLFHKFPSLSEGELTKLRASVVCQNSLAKIARHLKIGDKLLFDYGEESTGGRERDSNLEDAFESVVGAIYLDLGWETAREFVFKQLEPEFKNLTDENIAEKFQKTLQKNLSDYKSALQEMLMAEDPTIKFEYVELSMEGPPHQPTFEHAVKINGKIMGIGTGTSKKFAEQEAAKKAIQKLQRRKKKKAESDVEKAESDVENVDLKVADAESEITDKESEVAKTESKELITDTEK